MSRPGRSENDAQPDWRVDQLPRLWEVLADHTSTPTDCCFCVWEGFEDRITTNVGIRPPAGRGLPAAYVDGGFAPLPRADAVPGLGPAPGLSPGVPKVGASRELVDRLTSDPDLDVVPADPTEDQPAYR